MTTTAKKGYCPRQAKSKREVEAIKIVHGMMGYAAMMAAIVAIR